VPTRITVAAIWPIVSLNDAKVVDLKVDSYTYVYIRPARYHLHAKASFVLTDFNEDEKDFDFIIPSEAAMYYLQFSTGGSMTLAAGGTFVGLPTGGAGWFCCRSCSPADFVEDVLSAAVRSNDWTPVARSHCGPRALRTRRTKRWGVLRRPAMRTHSDCSNDTSWPRVAGLRALVLARSAPVAVA